MSGVVLDDSPGERVLLYGADGAVLRKVVVDSAGHLQVDVLSALDALVRAQGYDGAAWQNLLVESVTNPNLRVWLYAAGNRIAEAALSGDNLSASKWGIATMAALYGFDGSTYDRLRSDAAMHLYVNQYGVPGAERKSNLNAAAGANYLALTAVPSAKVYKVTNIHAMDINTAITGIKINCVVGGVERVLDARASPAAVYGVTWIGELYLAAGDYVVVAFEGCALNDDIYVDMHYVVLGA